MPFYTDNTIERMMAFNSFGSRFDPQSIPSYDDWVVNNTFDPFGPEPFAPTLYANPGIPIHPRTRDGFCPEEGMDVDSRFDRGYGSSEVDMTRNFPQERSRFAFAQNRIKCTTHRSPAGQSRIPVPIKVAPTTVSRVVGPRPFRSQRPFHARREPSLAVPKAVHPLPTWLTHFEDHEEELLTEFCPPSKDSSPSTSTFPMMVQVEPQSDRVIQCPSPLNTAPLLEFVGSNLGSTSTDVEVGGWCFEGDEDFDEDEDYDSFESDVDSDFDEDRVSFRSEPSTPASYYGVDAGEWPSPYQGHIAGGEGYQHVSAVTPSQGPPSLPSSGPHAPSFNPFDRGTAQSPGFLPWSTFINPFTGIPITETPPPQSSVAPVSTSNTMDDDSGADRFLMEVEEGLGSGLGSESSFYPDGWYNRFVWTFQVPPRQLQIPHVAAGFEVPPLTHTTTIRFPDVEDVEDTELDAVVISPRSPVYLR